MKQELQKTKLVRSALADAGASFYNTYTDKRANGGARRVKCYGTDYSPEMRASIVAYVLASLSKNGIVPESCGFVQCFGQAYRNDYFAFVCVVL